MHRRTNPEQRSASLCVPTVHMVPFLTVSNSAEWEKIIEDLRAACALIGFFQITGHGIPRQLQQNIFNAVAAFFALPLDRNEKLDTKTKRHDFLASQSYEADVKPDIKEECPSQPQPTKRRHKARRLLSRFSKKIKKVVTKSKPGHKDYNVLTSPFYATKLMPDRKEASLSQPWSTRASHNARRLLFRLFRLIKWVLSNMFYGTQWWAPHIRSVSPYPSL